ITIKDFFTSSSSIIETIELKNGYQFSARDIYQSFGLVYPEEDTQVPDVSSIPESDENAFVGGTEDDRYVFSGGNKTVIDSGGNDTIKFTQNGNGLNFSSNGTDLTLNVFGYEDDTITVSSFFTDPNNIVENFELNNGGIITAMQVYEMFGEEYPSGSTETFGLPDDTVNKVVQDLNSYSSDTGANLDPMVEFKNNPDIMQIYSV
ncbi:MAG: hypothetical protein GX282_01725, partial [Campylobacteraceae bacterium]|nr:hypothetical protein [Campylobacteraceae bacterium]